MRVRVMRALIHAKKLDAVAPLSRPQVKIPRGQKGAACCAFNFDTPGDGDAAHAGYLALSALFAGRTSVTEALCLIGEQMKLERRSLGSEQTTGCLGVVNLYIFRFRGPRGMETND